MSLDTCPPPETSVPVPRALPAANTVLVGREAEIARLCAMVATPGLVTVSGEGGVGKTRVVLEVARREARPVDFVPLADLDRTGATLAIRRVCAPLLVSRFDAATGTLRDGPLVAPAEDPRLLVLDSVEQVGQISDLIAEIRSTVGHLTILVTSRSRLGLSHERVLHLVGLPTTPDGPAVDLFLARAVAVGADPQAMAAQRPAIATLCRALDGVPLAIELAAARTRMMSPTALLAQMHSPNHRRLLTLLAKGPADLPTRQLSMRATLAWSHQLLEPAHQVLFRRLGVLPGSFSLDAAEAIAGDGAEPDADGATPGDAAEDVLDGIAEMVDLHLIEPVTAPADPEPVRFAMSDVARAFAAELLTASGDGPRVQRRLAHWCLDLLGRAELGITSVDEAGWLDRIDLELPAIRQSLAACAADGDWTLGLSLCLRLGEYWCRRGSPTEGIGWYRTFLEAAPESGADPTVVGALPGHDRARRLALGWWARLAVATGDLSRIEAIRAARPAAIDRHRPSAWMSWTDHLVLGLLMVGEYEECGLLIADGLHAAQEHGDPYWTCMFLLRRAFLRWMVVRCAQDRLAVQWARMAYVAATDTGLVRLAARAATLMSMSLMADRDWAGADRLLTRNLDVLRAAGDAQGTAMARNLLGITMIELDRPGEAAEHLVEAIGAARRCDDRLAEVTAAWAVSFLACRLGRHADAALAVDAVAGNGRLLERALPAPVVDDSRRAFAASTRQEPAPIGESAIAGWGWLSGWAVGIATEIATDHSPAAVPPFALGGADVVVPMGPAGAVGALGTLAPIGTAQGADEPATVEVGAPLASLASAAPAAASRPSMIATGDRVVAHVLTARELEILAAIASGRTNAQIASDFFLSTKTVMHHSVSIYRKLDVRGRAEAVALAYRSGLLRDRLG
ncbi:LuxR C-terminal-related transcriptional regulator [Nakamurella sp.]|uniref:LuxR C-terminal-related transcriptional regulator n=1 Tax=Nakamurella sp. TaxID=1869182 RepID=UPI0037832A43